MKIIIFLILSILFVNLQFVNSTSSCFAFADSKSNVEPNHVCGERNSPPCPTISWAISVCSLKYYDQITIIITPGSYSIDNIQTFGSFTNKSLTVYSLDNTAPVIVDLSKAIEPFFNIQPITPYDVSSIYINGITFINGNQTQGSVIINNGTGTVKVNVINSTFVNIVSPRSIGGAFSFIKGINNSIANSTVTFSNSLFSNISLGFSGVGGVFKNNLDIVFSFDNCTFSNISSNVYGAIGYMNQGYLIISNSIITKINSTAAFFLSSNSISNTGAPKFNLTGLQVSNSSDGIIFALQGNLTTSNFFNCSFENTFNVLSINALSTGQVTIDSCLFSNNNNSGSGQVIGGAISSNYSPIIVNNCVFINNSATIGGAILLKNDGNGIQTNSYVSPVIISNSRFTNNKAIAGGTIYNSNSIVTVINNQFDGNTANGSLEGSNVFCNNSTMEFQGNTFSNVQFTHNIYGISCPYTHEFCNITLITVSEHTKTEDELMCNIITIPKNNNNGLTTAQKIGVSFGVFGGVVLIVVIVVVVVRHKKNKYIAIN